MRHLPYVFLLVLLLCCVSVYATASSLHCGFNGVKKKRVNLSVAVVREVPAKGQGAWQVYTAAVSDTWAPIRIFVSTIDLYNQSMHCTAKEQLRPNFLTGMGVCQDEDILTNEKKRTLLDHVLPAAVKLHEERLLVKPLKGAFKVPEFDREDMCSAFSVPKEHRDPGFSGYDTVVYVAAGPSEHESVAWGVLCALLDTRRPVIGAMYFAPAQIAATAEMVRIAAHEMAHVLGFDRDIFYNANMITVKPNIRGKTAAVFLSSAKAVEKAREHYNCSTAPGIELEDDGGDATALSHWERRNAKDELMAGITGVGYYTALTMAAFEGTSYYRANWGMEETMSWGKDGGCEFLGGKCVENDVSKYPDFFCASRVETPVCTSDRRALGACVLFSQEQDLPQGYQYFNDRRLGGHFSELMDFCPIVLPWVDAFCSGDNKNALPGSRTGPSSWCLKGESLELNGKIIGDVCAEVQCENESIQVRYYGDDEWYPCPEGKVLKPKKAFTKGSIVCPKYREVCTIASGGNSLVLLKKNLITNEGDNTGDSRYSGEKGIGTRGYTEGSGEFGTMVQGDAQNGISPIGRRTMHDTTLNIPSSFLTGAMDGTDVSVTASLLMSTLILFAALSVMMGH